MHLVDSASLKCVVTDTEANGTMPGSTGRWCLTTNTDVYIRWSGTASVTAYDLFLPAGSMATVSSAPGERTISYIRDSANGVLSVTAIS